MPQHIENKLDQIVLKCTAASGEPLEATFLPSKGMNMISFKKGSCEIIDQSTLNLFEERFAGLGALIGPHFHRRHVVPSLKDESLFPHIARVKAKGVNDPFSHGIARYAPWKAEATDQAIKASLTGKDEWNGVPLAAIEGQNFKMQFNIALSALGLHLDLSVVSDTDSLVGIHYYYRLPQKDAKVFSQVQNYYLDKGKKTPFDSSWNIDDQHNLIFDLNNEADYTFHPFPNSRQGRIILDAVDYKLQTTYECPSQENSWQLYHPKGSSFVCIEPISAQDPRHPNLTCSSIKIDLQIL